MVATQRRNAPTSMDVASFRASIDTATNHNERIYRAAIWYAENGFSIVPFMPYGYPKGLSQRHATFKKAKIEEWFHPINGAFPGANIAMAHGGQAGFCAIDLDTKDSDGIQNLADLMSMYGSYNDSEGEDLQTLMASTPSGGRHLVFRYHPEVISNSESFIAGIDARGGLKKNPLENGGITFVEPSISIKKGLEGKTYRWDAELTEIRDIPQWLVDLLNGRKPEVSGGGIKLQDAYIQSGAGDHGEGRDRNIYMDLMRFAGIGYNEEQLWALLPDILARMDPPDEAMVKRKIESVINSDAFRNSKDEIKTKAQVAGIKLLQTDKGTILKCIENLETILMSPLFSHEYGLIEYDDFTQNFVKDKVPIAGVVDWSIGIQSWIARKFKLDYGKMEVRDIASNLAYSKPHANVAREYMLDCGEQLSYETEPDFWGSKRRGPGPAFFRLCTEVLDLGNPNLHPGYTTDTRDAYIGFLWFWMQGIVARACVPGCKMEMVLNIFGNQGIGKSLFFRDLCPVPGWFTDSIQDSIAGGGQNTKDELMKLQAKLIVEMPELNPIKRGGKSGDDKMKQFISTQIDNFRNAYGVDAVDHPRTCALAGTSNNNDVYRDSTGDRRFISIDHGSHPIRVGDIDNGVMAEIRTDLWGELVNSFNYGELELPWNKLQVSVPPLLRVKQNEINGAHRFEEIGIKDVIDWLEDKSRVTWAEILLFSRGVPGLRDAKESVIMTMVRKELSNLDHWSFKKRYTRHDERGDKEKTNFWVNTQSVLEEHSAAGVTAPPHWSKMDKPADDDTPEKVPEY
jgi:hypothetical protein